jgi:hypothetical protein
LYTFSNAKHFEARMQVQYLTASGLLCSFPKDMDKGLKKDMYATLPPDKRPAEAEADVDTSEEIDLLELLKRKNLPSMSLQDA